MADILVALINLKQDTDAAAAAAASKEKQQLVDELCGMLGRGVVADLEEVWSHIGRVGQTALQLEAALASSRTKIEELKATLAALQESSGEEVEGRRVEQVGKMAGEIQRLKAERDEWKNKFEALQAQGEGGRRPSASVSFIDLTND
jgi:predicted RNase H-like nuclease (RuvC/YqgF family)